VEYRWLSGCIAVVLTIGNDDPMAEQRDRQAFLIDGNTNRSPAAAGRLSRDTRQMTRVNPGPANRPAAAARRFPSPSPTNSSLTDASSA
jgi:hypothetical protein